MYSKFIKKSLRLVICIIIIVLLFIFLPIHLFKDGKLNIDTDFNSLEAINAEKELNIQFNKIGNYPRAIVNNKSSNHKSSKALVEAYYNSTSPYDDIILFYNEQLIKNGWQFVNKAKMYDWGNDLDCGFKLTYKKLNYNCNIQFAGKKFNYGWNYAIDYSWGF